MRISVITPFNRGTDYLKDCLDSLREQRLRVYIDKVCTAEGFTELAHLMELEEQGDEEAAGFLGKITGDDGCSAAEQLIGTPGWEGLAGISGFMDIERVVEEAEPADTASADDKTLSGMSTDVGDDDENDDHSEADEEEGRYISIPYRDFELILVTDHPVDDPMPLVHEYEKDIQIRVITLKDATGVAAARNLGIDNAKGDYIYFLDSDDYLYPDALYYIDQSICLGGDPDVTYGKKIWTWYTRAGYLSQLEKKRAEALAKKLKQDLSEAQKEEEERIKAESEAEAKKSDDSSDEIHTRKNDSSNEEDDSQGDDDASDGGGDDNRDDEGSDTGEAAADGTELPPELRLTPEEYVAYRRGNAAGRLITRRKGLRNVSALSIAYKKSLIEEHSIRFPVQFRYYADLYFVAQALEHAQVFRKSYKSKYLKRKHGDPINFPSLAQEKSPDKFDCYVNAFIYTRDSLPADSDIARRINRKFINYYTNFFVTRVRRSQNDYWRGERFTAMKKAMSGIPKEFFTECDRYKRKLIRILLKGDVKRTYRVVTRHLAVKKFRRCIKKPDTRMKAFYKHLFMKLPIRDDWMMFECFFGKNYGDNPKGIYEYMIRDHGGEFRYIWSMGSVKKGRRDIPGRHRTVKRQSIRYAYYVARCKYFVYNTKQPKWMKKRDGQVFLETWHGTPLKKLAFDMEDNFSAAPGYKKEIYGMTRGWDHLVSANKFSSEVFRRCFVYDGNMLEYGYPRNDILHRPDRDQLADSIKERLGIPKDKKTILYAPTWRDDEFYAAGKYKFSLKLNLRMMKEVLGDDYVILLRTHYYIADKLDVSGLGSFAINLSKYPDIADIYLISDICITDYSSVFFDYANLRRPMLFYTYDLDNYRDILRGFYFDMESTVPGPLLFTTEQVIEAIEHIDEISERFADRYDEFYDRFCGWEDGHASENIAKEVFGLR